jgi:NADH dehydrogenase [ubiquinone] 1 alpha subcomplex assembly factor 7
LSGNLASLTGSLDERLAARIARAGPITVAEYMAAALTDPDGGYYRTTDPLGAAGDFTTAPEISQLFGELIGAWLIDCWIQAGRPAKFNLVELGPGRGTLMADALRVGCRMPDWLAAAELHLVEINPALRALQDKALSSYRPRWHDGLATVPAGPLMLVANEFFDALPVRQLVFWDGTWRERLVDWSAVAGFHFAISPKPSSLSFLVPLDLVAEHGNIYELSPTAIAAATAIAGRIAKHGGAALIVDYGRSRSATGDTLQAVRGHKTAAVLAAPGSADLSAHVDFSTLCRIAGEAGIVAVGPASQGAFLEALGIHHRAERLKRGLGPDAAADIDLALKRLTDPAAMGELFKVMAMTTPAISPAGFATPSAT